MEDLSAELWTYAQVADRIKCCIRKVRDDYVKTGKLPVVPLGPRSPRFRPADVEGLIRQLSNRKDRGDLS
jgi:hypothetical protein